MDKSKQAHEPLAIDEEELYEGVQYLDAK